jgi:2'-5' RNA ligase
VLRLFIAADIDPALRGKLSDLIDTLSKPRDGVRWVKEKGIHLTLKFFGAVDEKEVPRITAASREAVAGTGDITLSVGGIGTFPKGKRPRVIWVGIGGEVDRLKGVKDALEDALYPLGYPKEERPFNPHLTLGRVRGRVPVELLEKIDELQTCDMGEMVISGLHLFQSELRPTGAVYTPLAQYPLTEE